MTASCCRGHKWWFVIIVTIVASLSFVVSGYDVGTTAVSPTRVFVNEWKEGDTAALENNRHLQYQPPAIYSSDNTYTVTTNKNWFQRMGDSFWSAFFGVLLCFGAPILLFWNEGRAVKRRKQIEYVAKHTKTNVTTNDSNNEGALVHVVGLAKPRQSVESGGEGSTLQDSVFGVPPYDSAKDLLVLQRRVEMMQWVEHSDSKTEKTAGGGSQTTTTYSYNKEWRHHPVDSFMFHHTGYQNPPMKYQGETFHCEGGAELKMDMATFRLSDQLHHKIPATEQYNTAVHGAPPPSSIKLVEGGSRYGSVSEGEPIWTDTSTLEFGSRPADVGTHRVTWAFSRPCKVSIIAQQWRNGLTEWTSPDGSFTCCRLQTGERTLGQMIEDMRLENHILTWLLRLIGFLLWGFALQSIAKPLEVIFDLGTIPFLHFEPGTIVAWLTGVVAFLIAFALSLIVIAIAWIFYRPLLGMTLLAIAMALFWFLPKPERDIDSAEGGSGVAASISTSSCPGGSLVGCTNICRDLMDAAYKICIESCVEKCA